VVFDKTGTLTRDGMTLASIGPVHGMSDTHALGMAAAMAAQSLHPVSRALVRAAQERDAPVDWTVSGLQETPGQGLQAQVQRADGAGSVWHLRLGSPQYTGCATGDVGASADAAGSVWLAKMDQAGQPHPLARFGLAEDLRAQGANAVAALRQAGLAVHLLSGDRREAVARLAERVGIADWQAQCTPADKLAAVKALQAQGRRVAMVGDGLNDGPVLAAAHASFAFGRAVPLAQAQADFVVPGDDLSQVVRTIALAQQAVKVVRQNLWWAAAYNAASVPLAVAGYMPAWLAGLGMALSSLLVILNAARLSVTPSAPLPQASGQVSALRGQAASA
jgi:Cu2+-exporting ATPase